MQLPVFFLSIIRIMRDAKRSNGPSYYFWKCNINTSQSMLHAPFRYSTESGGSHNSKYLPCRSSFGEAYQPILCSSFAAGYRRYASTYSPYFIVTYCHITSIAHDMSGG